MKKLIIVLAVMLTIFVFTGCAATTAIPARFISTNNGTEIDLRGEATNTVYFLVFGKETYPPAERVARDNGITKIATDENYTRVGVLGLWTEYTTIVTGTGPNVSSEPE